MKPAGLIATVTLAAVLLATVVASSCGPNVPKQIATQADSGAADAARTLEALRLLRGVAHDDSLLLAAALMRNEALAGRLRAVHIAPPIMGPVPDTCRAYAARASQLDTALALAQAQIANIPNIVAAATAEQHHLAQAADSGAAGLRRAEVRFDTVRVEVAKIMVPRAPVLQVVAQADWHVLDGWPRAEVDVQYHALYLGGEVQPVAGAFAVRAVVGIRKSLKLF